MAYDPKWSDTTTSRAGGGFELSNSMFRDLGGAANDIFSFFGSQYREKGNRLEAENYDRAAGFSDLEAEFTKTSTGIKLAQEQRVRFQQEGTVAADVGGAGFTQGGSALDILRQTHEQGALESAVLQQQGLIQEEGYRVQAKNYRNMADASRTAADAQNLGGMGSLVSAGLKLAPYALMAL